MKAFPDDLKSVVLTRAKEETERKKIEYMNYRREAIFQSLFLSALAKRTETRYILDPGHYDWELEVCNELLNQHEVKVDLHVTSVTNVTNLKASAKIPPSPFLLDLQNWAYILDNDKVAKVECAISFL